MNDAEWHNLMEQLGNACRRKVVAALLAGNNTCCFTTEQYVQEYVRQNRIGDPYTENWLKWIGSLAEKHLRSVGCQEVKPGIWTKSGVE
jgi:hypothetical protein